MLEDKIVNLSVFKHNFRNLSIYDEYKLVSQILEETSHKLISIRLCQKYEAIRVTRRNAAVRKIQRFLKKKTQGWGNLVSQLKKMTTIKE